MDSVVNEEYSRAEGDVTESSEMRGNEFIESELTRESGILSGDVDQERPPKRGRELNSEEIWTTVTRKSKRFGRADVINDTEIIPEDKIEVCLTCTEKLPKQFGLAKILKSENVQNVIRVKYINSYKVLVQFNNEESAEHFVTSKTFNENGYKCYKTLETNQSYGVINNVDLELSEEEIMKGLSCTSAVILSAKRLKRKNTNDGHWEISESVRLSFKGASLPAYVYVYDTRSRVTPFTFPVTQCSRCWRFGHTIKMCTSFRTICPKCSGYHANCTTTKFICNNCNGRHMAMAKICPVFRKEKKVRELMTEFNCTYKRALTLYVVPSPIDLDSEEDSPIIANESGICTSSIPETGTVSQGGSEIPTYASITKRTPKRSLKKTKIPKRTYEERMVEDVLEQVSEASENESKLEENTDRNSKSKYEQISWRILLKKLKDKIFEAKEGTWFEKIKDCLSNRKTLIAGDLNGHHTNWSTKSDVRGNQLFDSLIENNYIYLNDGSHTRIKLVNGSAQKSSPDVSFLSADVAFDFSWSVLNESLGSDHLMIKIKTEIERVSSCKARRNFKLADWNKYRNYIEESLVNFGLDDNHQSAYDDFINIINRAAQLSIPCKKIFQDPIHHRKFTPKPYWNQEISRAIAERRKALGAFRRNPTPDNLTFLQAKISLAQRLIRDCNTKSFRRFCDSIDEVTSAGEMWSKIKWIKGYKASRDILTREKADALLCSLAPDYVTPTVPDFGGNNPELSLPVSLQELKNSIKISDTAPGMDDISYSMISHLPESAQKILVILFNRFLNDKFVPNQWRDVKVVPVPKPGVQNSQSSDKRPIALISCLCKILHTIINRRLEWYFEKSLKFPEEMLRINQSFPATLAFELGDHTQGYKWLVIYTQEKWMP
ncbi:unnamed protein product [Colias eurytheme]|nr:unnamed protein product [Colias eurytheme]